MTYICCNSSPKEKTRIIKNSLTFFLCLLLIDFSQVVRTQQQQENLKFMAHFKRRFIIHQGKRKEAAAQPQVELYHLRSNGTPLTTRLVQTRPDSSQLNSAFWWVIQNHQSSIASLIKLFNDKHNSYLHINYRRR